MRPISMSAMANDAINQFCTFVKLFSVAMAITTNMFPITITIIIAVMMMARRMT
uniref:Uncharacterized protein n=1 Tax=Lepeophtheirus salmonis TaxID=72036 RepID=A0A0K2UEG8_LEPSM